MIRILVTGSNGLLGQKITDLALRQPDLHLIATSTGPNRHPTSQGYTYDELDIRDGNRFRELIVKHRPDVVINSAAMTNVDSCETNQDLCRQLNVEAVETMASVCEEFGIHLIHLSTDFIFDGADGPYSEDADPSPLSFYGQTKLEAEQALRKSACKSTIIRTIIVYGVVNDMSRSNIVLWAKGALEKGQPVNVVTDQWRMPTLAEDLATACLLAAKSGKTGIYNVSGKDFMSILEIVERVARFWKLDSSLIRPVSSSTLNQTAKRPVRTGFILDKAINELGYAPRSFEEGLAIVDEQLKSLRNDS